jgi:hypothetical protein
MLFWPKSNIMASRAISKEQLLNNILHDFLCCCQLKINRRLMSNCL